MLAPQFMRFDRDPDAISLAIGQKRAKIRRGWCCMPAVFPNG
jgi:hypothetical protein